MCWTLVTLYVFADQIDAHDAALRKSVVDAREHKQR
jgi:hypothetical protein